jgi:hypothetical protein
MANLNDHDDREVRCQLVDDPDMAALAKAALIAGETRIAYYRTFPAMFFGTTPMTVSCMSAWAVGTDDSRRVIPAVSRCFIDELIPDRLDEGFNSMEARAMVTNEPAMHWLLSMGGEQLGKPFLFGKGGEMFTLFRWTVASYRTIRESRWSENHVSRE